MIVKISLYNVGDIWFAELPALNLSAKGGLPETALMDLAEHIENMVESFSSKDESELTGSAVQLKRLFKKR